MVTEEEVRREVADLKEEIAQEIADNPEEGPVPSFLMPVFSCGHWLGKKLKVAGATKEEREGACFAMGQRACMAGATNAYRIAAECFNRWEEGHKDQPGRELAEQLVDEAIQS